MPQQNKWVKLVSSFIVASLLAGTPAVGSRLVHADTAVSATRFSDVPAGHWAEKHIAKLASQGVIKGTNGAFKPNDNITQQEAVALAIRFIGSEGEVKTDDAVVFPENFDVNTYFKPYVILAFEKGLLDRNAEFKLADADPGSSWGSKKASREWITKLLVKAIGKQATADGLASSPIAFKDGNEVGAGYAGFVNAAVSMELIKGVTADKFEPKGNITRAAIATMFSRAEKQFPVNYAGQTTAILTSTDGSTLQLFQGDKDASVGLNSDTYVYRYDSDKAVTTDKLVPNTKLLVVASGGKALYVEQLDDAQQVEKISGTIDRVLPNDSKLWVWVNDDPVAINYSAATKVTDGSGNIVPISSLTKDSKVEITRDTYRAKPLALSIAVQSAPVNKTGQGTVQAIQTTTPATLTIQDASSGTSSMYGVSSDMEVVWQDQILDGGLSQLRVGDIVSYEVKNSVVTRVTIVQTSAKLVRGEFNSASSDGTTISYIKNVGTAQQALEAKFMAASVDVTIEGLTGTTISDLIKGDLLEITVNDENKVTAIKVVNRKVTVMAGATIIGYDTDLKALTVKDTAGNLASVYLTDKTKLDLNGTVLQLSAASTFLLKGKRITIGFTDSKAVFVQFVYRYSGTVSAINTTTNQVTLLQGDGTSVALTLDYGYAVEIAGKTSATIGDVKTGDIVTALLNANQDKVASLQVATAKQVEVYAVDIVGKKVKLKSSDGTINEYSTAVLDLTNEKGDKLTIANLAVGQLGNLGFVGQGAASFKVINVTLGKLSAIAPDKVTLTDYSGKTVDIALSAGYTVVKNGATGTSASVLAAGDRVEAKADAKGRLVLTVIPGVTKKFWKYDAATKMLSVKRETLTDTYTYAVTATTKITQNGATIGLGQLADGDAIVLYFYRDALIEVAKA